MTRLIIPYPGSLIMNDWLLAQAQAYGTVLHLLGTAPSPALSRATVIGDLTEATFTGYLPVTNPIFSPSFLNGSNHAEADSAAFTFTNSGLSPGAVVWGYYFTDAAGNLIWVQQDPAAPIDMSFIGATYTVTPVLTYYSEYP
jgi:hypothetical protein